MSGATLTVLGAGSILPRNGYGCSGYALRPGAGERVTLFDCGPGSVRALGAAGIELREVERVVLTHFHIDHCLDLFALAFARNNKGIQPVPRLEIVGPLGLAELLARGENTLGRRAKDPNAVITEVALDAGGRASIERDGVRLSCVANGHRPEAVSWRADLEDGASFAYTGDTPEDPRVAELARDVDLFVIECSNPDDCAVAGHLTPSSAGRLARDAQCRRALLTHFYPDMDPELARAGAAVFFSGPIELARDGSVHTVADRR